MHLNCLLLTFVNERVEINYIKKNKNKNYKEILRNSSLPTMRCELFIYKYFLPTLRDCKLTHIFIYFIHKTAEKRERKRARIIFCCFFLLPNRINVMLQHFPL